ncbi:MAG TPA: hypothetical protein PK395_22190, partial [bacterium]|nr:hypothetical protein [bacterium]
AAGEFTYTGVIPTEGNITATVTDPDGNTSAFSRLPSPFQADLPVDHTTAGVNVLLEDHWFFKVDVDNALYWEPSTDIFGDGTIAVAAGTYPEGATDSGMNCKVGLINRDDTVQEHWAWRADNGTSWTANFNVSRTDGNPPRIACDRREGATRFLVGQEGTPWAFSAFNTDGRFSGAFQYDRQIAAVQLYNKAAGGPTPLTHVFDPIYGAGNVAGSQNNQQIRFGGDLCFLSNGNFVACPEDQTRGVCPTGTAPILTIFNGETGAVIKGPFNGRADDSSSDIWSNVTAFNGGFCVRSRGLLTIWDNDGNLRYYLDQNQFSTDLLRDRGDMSRVASTIGSDYIYLVSRNNSGQMSLARFDAAHSSQGHIVGIKEVIVAEAWETSIFDRSDVAIDDYNNACVVWEEAYSGQNEQIVARIYDSSMNPVTPTFYAFKDHDAWNDANQRGFHSEKPSVSMDGERIVIAADGIFEDPDTSGLTPQRQVFVTVLKNPVNLRPVANNQAVSAYEDIPKGIVLT